jgi:hypothetical protein
MAVAVVAILTSTSNAEATQSPAVGGDDVRFVPTATVRVDNLATIPNEYLQFAEGRAAAIFSGIGARIIWLDEGSAIQQHVNPSFTLVVLRTGYAPGRDSRSVDALGTAIPSVRRAHVFYDRIEALNGSSNSILSILGDVMAHELGHLLLPPPGHSLGGIMRPNVMIRWAPAPTFSKSQAVEILRRLRQLG